MKYTSIYEEVAQIHIESLKEGFLPSLGHKFLTLLYQSIDECNSSVLIVERQDDEIIGFVAAAESMLPIYSQMCKHFIKLFLYLFPVLIHPYKLMKIIEIFQYTRGASISDTIPKHELLSIAVKQKYRNCGVAQRLYKKLEEYFFSRGITAFRIVVGNSLKAASKFYLKMGAVMVADINVHRSTKAHIFVQSL
jgi:ribosomal protein S18 acetylase RimI-like enzyme